MYLSNNSFIPVSVKSMNLLEADFISFNLPLSVSNKMAFKGLFDSFEASLTGELESKYYLSSLDPGSGKTQAISCFLKAWKSNGFFPEGSVLVGVKTKDEIKGLVKRLGLDDADFACLTRDDEINALGLGDGRQNEARILITTQQMILSRTRDRSFSAASDFHFEGKPRSLRIWDESLVLAEPVTLSWGSLAELVEPLKRHHREFSRFMERFLSELPDEENSLVTLPSEFGQFAGRVLEEPRGLGDSYVATLKAIRRVAGRSFWLVAESGQSGRALVGASKPLPADFAPVIITDASGRVRGTYDIWESAGGLIRLHTSAHDYGNVRVHLWATSVGKDVLRDDQASRRIYREVAKVMEAKKGERWLVISHKQRDDLNVKEDLRATVALDVPFEYLWWGRHHGTNDYKDVKNIVVIGSGFYADVTYKALALAASGKPVGDCDVGALPNLKGSEFQHNILQAVMRGNARNSRDGVAGECDVYIVASRVPEPAALIEEAFPGCVLERWGPPEEGLSQHGKALMFVLQQHLANHDANSMSKKALREAVGIGNKQQFGAILKQIPVKMMLERLGLVVRNKSICRL
ncbi:hypothetical protein [Sphingomonas trueperi]|uniref:hypothetical protein n=1 Tax=Sphingomonas trueperi TaxID=53317 RepID=UPI000F295B16